MVVGASPGGPEPVYQWCPGPSDKLSGHLWSKGSTQLAGWLVLWETEGQPLPKQRPSILSRDLVAGPSGTCCMYPECQHAWSSPASCLAEGSFPEVSSAVGEPSYFIGPHRWGGAVKPSSTGPAQGIGQDTTGGGDLLQKGQRWVSSFARRGHLCESHHCLLRADLS